MLLLVTTHLRTAAQNPVLKVSMPTKLKLKLTPLRELVRTFLKCFDQIHPIETICIYIFYSLECSKLLLDAEPSSRSVQAAQTDIEVDSLGRNIQIGEYFSIWALKDDYSSNCQFIYPIQIIRIYIFYSFECSKLL